MITFRSVTKRIASRTILEAISFEATGIVVLLGRNGAGKSTLLRLGAGVWHPDQGSVLIDDHDLATDPVGAKRRLGYQPEHPDLHPSLRPIELLAFAAAARGLPSEAPLSSAELWGAADLLKKPVRTMSLGERRLVTLLAATMHNPDVLLLDEPTNALDPLRLQTLVRYLRSGNAPATTILSTHDLDFAAEIGDRFLFLRDGHIGANGTLAELRDKYQQPTADLRSLVLAAI